MVLKIVQVGASVLREEARPLTTEEILSDAIQGLIALMRDTMRDAPGVGLAAPQIGMPLQIAVIEDRQSYIEKLPAGQAAERQRVPVDFHVVINPVLVRDDDCAPVEFTEGCLSLAGFSAIVPRFTAVRVECLNERAEPVVIQARDWYARILQHEIDHLHGMLYIDRMKSRTFAKI